MTTKSKDEPRVYELGDLNSHPVVQSDIIYEGSAVGDNGSGYARPLVAGDNFLGFAYRKADNASGQNGDVRVIVQTRGLVQLAVTGVVITSVGADVYASDDDAFTLTASTNSRIGKVYRYVSDGIAVVSFDVADVKQSEELADHLADTEAAHAASAISLLDEDTHTEESDVEGAIAELYTGIEAAAAHAIDAEDAHAASAISILDAGDHFAAAEDDVESALQKLAKTIVITLPGFTGWTKDGADKAIALPALELPVPVKITRAYVNLSTAPGSEKTLALKLNTSALVSITGTDTQGEAEALAIAVAADTDFAITANETAEGSAADCDIILVAQLDDGEE